MFTFEKEPVELGGMDTGMMILIRLLFHYSMTGDEEKTCM